ncbi:MAG: hypothetical protein AB7F35_17315 [Acetobacteraceae bacterium]
MAAPAAPSGDPGIREWFKQLRVPGTLIPCCDVSDCRIVRHREAHGLYEIEVEGKWYSIPPERVLREHRNPTMSAVACYHLLRLHVEIEIFCFVPPEHGT